MADYRPIPDERVDEFRAFVTYAFRPESGPYDPEEADELPAPARIGERRGLFDDVSDELLAVCRHYWFDAQVAGQLVSTAGLSAVASPPENRRQGLVRELLAESLAEYRERGVALSVLWPFHTPFYRQFGWATCNKIARTQVPPEALQFVDTEEDGRMRPLDPDDWSAMAEVLAAHGTDYELTLDRSEEWWRKRVFHSGILTPMSMGGKMTGAIYEDTSSTKSRQARATVRAR
ncbi:GNAT family N-acetyltransferase [Halospeciosus flavus]|uniref:GNAT family N-acetyltransferase n=1 Tax=Halospeciosus flavus TaxID=3032283 RepID=UPI00361747F5